MRRKEVLFLAICATLSFLVLLVSICVGATKISVMNVLKCIFYSEVLDPTDTYIIRFLRIPRSICAFLCGGILALSGLCFQTVFKNPLSDSYVLGISSGASFSVALGFILGLKSSSVFSLPLIAFIGSTLTSLTLFYSNKKNIHSMLLSGIALNFFLSACTSLFIYIGKKQAQLVIYWTMGSLSSSSYIKAAIFLFFSIFLLIILLKKNSTMDKLLLNDTTSYSLGINVNKERIIILLVASLSTSVVVAYCGVIGFIGLMCPHIVRLVLGPKHKALIACSFILGSLVLQVSDIISRLIIPNSELPIGLITSVLGAPVFFILISKKRRLSE